MELKLNTKLLCIDDYGYGTRGIIIEGGVYTFFSYSEHTGQILLLEERGYSFMESRFKPLVHTLDLELFK